nr:hypothetical protein [Lentzea pudingi]
MRGSTGTSSVSGLFAAQSWSRGWNSSSSHASGRVPAHSVIAATLP